MTSVEANGMGPKVVETIAKALGGVQVARWSGGAPAASAAAGVETIVEREIREQRERELAVAAQRAAALMHAPAPPPPPPPPSPSPPPPPSSLSVQSVIDKNEANKEDVINNSSEESNEIPKPHNFHTRELLVTVESNKIITETKLVDDINDCDGSAKTPDSMSDSFLDDKENSMENLSNDFSFQCSTKDSWQKESPEIDTSQDNSQDVDSISTQTGDSGLNSPREHHSSRSILVKPLSEPDDDSSSYIRWQKETPIEREIRLVREREEELRRDKGLPPLLAALDVAAATATVPGATPARKNEVQKLTSRRNFVVNDCRSVQHRIATNRIQQEINEATAREKELHAAGLIQTISEDTVDSKVTRFTDLAGYAIEEKERTLRRAVSTSAISQDPDSQTENSNLVHNGLKSPTFRQLFENTPNNYNINSIPSKKLPSRIGHKGVMQRFLASRGKFNSVNSYNSTLFMPVQRSPTFSPIITANLSADQSSSASDNLELNGSPRKNVRHGYLSAEERIQTELQEMQKREEELRLQRAKIFAQSQPNLLSILDFEEHNGNDKSEDDRRSAENSENGSHVENSKETTDESSFPDRLNWWNSRKRNALIAQWENRIKQNLNSD